MGRRWVVELVLLAVLAGAGAFMVTEAFGLRYEARLFPLVWLGFTLALVAVQAVVVVVRSRVAAASETLSEGFETDFWSPVALRRAGRLAAWVAGMLLLVWVVGLLPGVSVGTLLYVRVEGRMGWLRSALLGAVSFGYLWLVLGWGLGLSLVEGSALLR